MFFFSPYESQLVRWFHRSNVAMESPLWGKNMEKPLKKMVDFQLPALMTCISCEKSWQAANMKYGMAGVIWCMTGVITPASQPAAILPGHWYHWYHWVPFTLEYQRLTDIIDIPRIQSHHVSPSVSFPPQKGGGCAPQCAPWHHGTMAPWHHGTMAFRKAMAHLQDGWSSAWVANVWAATCPRTWKTAISSYRDSRIFWRPVSPCHHGPGAAGLAGQVSVAPFLKGIGMEVKFGGFNFDYWRYGGLRCIKACKTRDGVWHWLYHVN